MSWFYHLKIGNKLLCAFSLVIAALCCLNMPLGTVLGVFTFIVLTRDSVKAQYAAR